jgi:hypothetical protein
MQAGISFRERLTGNYWLLDAPTDERAVTVELEAHTGRLGGLLRDGTWRITGKVDAERLASGRALEGTLAFKLIEERRVSYRFAFWGDDQRRYELSGQKEWSSLAPLEILTLLPASLYDDRGEEIARATLRFDLRSDWAWWLRGVRLRLSTQT